MKNSAFNHATGVPRWLRQTLLVMRIATLILLAALLQVSASSLAQKITIDKKNASIQTILNEISKQSGYDFFYDANALKKIKPISIAIKNADLDDAVKKSLEGLPLSYTIDNKTVVIKEAQPSLLDKLSAVISNIVKDLTVKGKVVDQDGKPLPNASIRVKGKSAVTNTNQNGEFEIKDVANDAVLLISYVGFKTLEIALKDAVIPLEIKLNVATGELEEVKVTYSTGYQNIPKERATGSFVQIDNEMLNRTVSTNILDRVTKITSSLTNPNRANTNMSIRGLSTINANQRPLLVVDGFPYEGEIFGSETTVRITDLNPNDVESITILRDAAAASIWGVRSGNGVIVITTKKGKYNQKTNIQINSSVNVVERPDLFKMNIISPADMIEYERNLFKSGFYDSYNGPFPASYTFPVVSPAIEVMLAQKRGAISGVEAEQQLSKLASHDIRTDINKYLLQNSVNQQYNFNISGGSEKMNYYSSIGYDQNLSERVGDKNNRLTLTLKNKYRPIKKFELITDLNYTQSTTTTNGIDYTEYLANGGRQAAPYTMLADDNGVPLHTPNGMSGIRRTAYLDTVNAKGLLDWHYRPIEEITNNDNIGKSQSVRISGELKYDILEGLTASVFGQYEKRIINTENYYSTRNYLTRNLINSFMSFNVQGQPQYPIPLGGILDFNTTTYNSYNFRGTLNLNKTWGNHSLSGISGLDINEIEYDSNSSRKYGYDPLTLGFAPNMDYRNTYPMRPFGNGLIGDNGRLLGRLNRNFGSYANLGYTLLQKYTLTLSGRVDASNFFGIKASMRFVPLWSTGVKWNIFNEPFFKSSLFSSLVLRATYGVNGNTDNTATSLPTISYRNGTSIYTNSQQFAQMGTPPNPGLGWEKVKTLNLAVDFSILKNGLSGSLDVYTKKAYDLIAPILSEPTTGIDSYTGNAGILNGKGFDLQLNAVLINHQLKYNTSLSLSYNTEKIVDYYNSPSVLQNSSPYLTGSLPITGNPRYYLYSYRWAGLNGINGDPMGLINTQVVPFTTVLGSSPIDGSSNTKPADLVYHGRANSSFFGNMLNTFSYKGISLSFNTTYEFGSYFRRPSVNYTNIRNFWGGHGDYKLRWQKPGDEKTTSVPSMPSVTDARHNFYSLSEILIEKGDQIRLDDFRIAFSITRNVIKKLPFTQGSLFLNANNLGVILWRANDKRIDPDFYNNQVPTPRSIAFGLTLNL